MNIFKKLGFIKSKPTKKKVKGFMQNAKQLDKEIKNATFRYLNWKSLQEFFLPRRKNGYAHDRLAVIIRALKNKNVWSDTKKTDEIFSLIQRIFVITDRDPKYSGFATKVLIDGDPEKYSEDLSQMLGMLVMETWNL